MMLYRNKIEHKDDSDDQQFYRIKGIPDKAYVASSIYIGYYRNGFQYSYQNFTVSNGTDDSASSVTRILSTWDS